LSLHKNSDIDQGLLGQNICEIFTQNLNSMGNKGNSDYIRPFS